MPVVVCKAFLDDPENRRLNILRQPFDLFGGFEIDLDLAALGEPFQIPAN
jgi:hypothetical protein